MSHCETAKECAIFLNVSYDTFKKYAKMYVDSDSNKTLFELSKSNGRRKRVTSGKYNTSEKRFKRIISGEIRNPHSINKLGELVSYFSALEEKCSCCGYDEARIDFKKPLLLDFIDGDKFNAKLENLRWLCYNCFFQMVGDLKIVRRQYTVTDDDILNLEL